MSKIVSIGTAVPQYKHRQDDILEFMQRVYAPDDSGRRKLKFLYHKGGIEYRYSVIPDYSLPATQWEFYTPTENLEPFPSLEMRMEWFRKHAAAVSMDAIRNCLNDSPVSITHLITATCTGMSAPGLDIEIMEALGLPETINRTSVNFMGCYAAIHALKLADAYARCDASARVLVVCTELCTLHFQREATTDNITSSMLFGDGAAAVLVSGDELAEGLNIDHFYSSVSVKGKKDMAWELSSSGFRMTLSGYVADLIGEDFNELVTKALSKKEMTANDITQWCVHPGGKRILEAVHDSLNFENGQLDACYDILKEFGNMSSATILFVLKRILQSMDRNLPQKIFGAAFGPGLTMETFILSA